MSSSFNIGNGGGNQANLLTVAITKKTLKSLELEHNNLCSKALPVVLKNRKNVVIFRGVGGLGHTGVLGQQEVVGVHHGEGVEQLRFVL